MNIKRIVTWAVIGFVAFCLLIQLVPYGRVHSNPTVQSEPNWDSPETRALAKTACFDCHSNEVNYDRWYTSVAPASWLVQHDVEDGRRHLNFSEWNQGGKPRELEEMWEEVERGKMPPWPYTILHSEAVLTPEQANQLIAGLKATFSNR